MEEKNIYLVVKTEESYDDSYGDIPDPYDVILGVYDDPSEALMYANDAWELYTSAYDDVPVLEGEWIPLTIAPASLGFEIKWQLGVHDYQCVRHIYISVVKIKIGSHKIVKPPTDDVKE